MATITITTQSGQDARIAAAFGDKLGLGGSASAAQIKGAIIEYVRNIVLNYEKEQARIAATGSVSAVTIT